ncbi:MAG TPA: DUF6345 domain-containing protein [Polyangiales bacterium]|nr:DUF6345 domain-containing protein [Polyangiales bacterium]
MRIPRFDLLKNLRRWKLAIPILLLGSPAQAEYESVAHAVRYYGWEEGRCGCFDEINKPCTEPAIWETYAATFDNRMTTTMAYEQTEKYLNMSVDPFDFVDPALNVLGPGVTYGADADDPYGTDFADVIFYAGHGNHACNSTEGWNFELATGQQHPAQPGQQAQSCWLRTDKHLRWGDEDANVAILFSCSSVQHCVWDAYGYDAMATGQFNVLLGFHGTMLLSSANNTRLDGYLAGTKTEGIIDDWFDEITQIKSGADNDECGTAIVFGPTKAERDNVALHAGYRDLITTPTSNNSSFWYIDGCDPHDGEAL